MPLSGLSLGMPDGLTGSLSPGVAVARDGSRYFVVHADRPVLDVVDTRAPRLERLERKRVVDGPTTSGTREAWLGVSADGTHLFTWRRAESPADDLGLQVVDVGTWRVQTVDAIAERMGSSLDGHWLFQLDPPAAIRPGVPPPPQRGPRSRTGARLSVLDAATRTEVAVLADDQFFFSAGQYGADRFYVTQADRGPRGPGCNPGVDDRRLRRDFLARDRPAVAGCAERATEPQPTLVTMPHVALNGVELFYEDSGGPLPSIVFCHEFAGDYRAWDPQVRAFGRAYRCITYSHRGFPPSSVPDDPEAYSQDLLIEDLRALVEHLGLARALFVGFSMGGNVVLNFALRYPNLCRGIVVAGTGAGTTNRERFERDIDQVVELIGGQGIEGFAETYAVGPTRLQFRRKDPHGWAVFRRQLAEHSPTGQALTRRAPNSCPSWRASGWAPT